MRKKAIVVLAEGFEEIEAVAVIDILRRAGIDVTIAGLAEGKVIGSHGIEIIADKALTAAGFDFDACVLPGGMPGAKNLASSEKVQLLIQKMYSAGKLIAAICASPALLLAPIGVLKNKKATCYPGMQCSFGKDVTYEAKNVVVDGNIITSRGPATALEFAINIAENLLGKNEAGKLRKATLL